MDKKNDEIIIELFDKEKKSHKYELLDIVVYNDVEYAVLLPKDGLFNNDSEVEIFKMKHTDDKSATLYEAEKNNYIIMQVYESFKEKYQKYYSNRIKFED
jgi:uncharacterized protein YrzB (UPF0473 family)